MENTHGSTGTVLCLLYFELEVFSVKYADLVFLLDSMDKKSPGIGYTSKVRIRDKYHIVGFISSGTYGRVYKATGKNGKQGEFAIKKSVLRFSQSLYFDLS